jgi:8-hydroxy-5-deazaflavin:NADPH oxidoreductase
MCSCARGAEAGERREIHSAAMPEPIPIIGGTGALGWGLALRLATSGQPVVIGSRSVERATQAVERLGDAVPSAEVEGLVNEEAARRGPIVFLTVPFRAQSENLTNLREALEPGQILVDCTVPTAAAVSGKATRTLGVWQGSAAQQAQEMVPEGVTVVAALHTVSAPTLGDPGAELDEDVLICGDRRADKARVAGIVELVPGLRAVNAGTLEMARIVEQLTPLLISINARYKLHAGIRITGLGDGSPWE